MNRGMNSRLLPFVLALGCGAPQPLNPELSAPAWAPVAPRARWPEAAYSPQPALVETGFAEELIARCGLPDGALQYAALQLGRRLTRAAVAPNPSQVTEWLRDAGSPYVWPRAWTLLGKKTERSNTARRMVTWLASFDDGGERRCGATVLPGGADLELVSVVAVDALADLRPLAQRVRVASWVEVEADLLVPSAGNRLVVLGPRGIPKNVIISEHASTVRGRFNADHFGVWRIQLLASVAGGPRPVLEAFVFAGEEPEPSVHSRSAPGEDAYDVAGDPRILLAQMLGRARAEAGAAPLVRDERLDQLAQEHASRMQWLGRVVHDTGQGDAGVRLQAAGIRVISAGENVAHAGGARAAHRTLWASPSHRANLLSNQFNSLGVGVAVDPDGSLWICQLMARIDQQAESPGPGVVAPEPAGLQMRGRAD